MAVRQAGRAGRGHGRRADGVARPVAVPRDAFRRANRLGRARLVAHQALPRRRATLSLALQNHRLDVQLLHDSKLLILD